MNQRAINPNSGRDQQAAADRAKERIDGQDAPKESKNPGYAAPAPIPFEASLDFAFRACGGKATALAGARLVDDDRYRKLAWAYDEATERDKENLTLEVLCEAAGIPADEFIGTVISVIWRRNRDVGKLVAATTHAEVVKATVVSAQIPGPMGVADRKMLLESSGFLPQKKDGVNINIDTRHQTVIANQGGAPTKGLPSFEEEGIEIHDAIRREEKKALAAPAKIENVTPVVEAEFVDVPRS